jgi:hypothetical protein
VLVAGILHDRRISIGSIKQALAERGVPVRAGVRGMSDLLQAAADAARIAGERALRHYRTALAVEHKPTARPSPPRIARPSRRARVDRGTLSRRRDRRRGAGRGAQGRPASLAHRSDRRHQDVRGAACRCGDP